MTALCGGGSSRVRSGVDLLTFLSTSAITAVLARVGFGRLAGLAAYLGISSIDVAALCATDPPGFVALTLAEGLAILNTNPTSPDYATGIAKMQANVLTALWYDWCECSSVSTPAVPTPPAAPTDYPAFTGPPGVPCRQYTVGPFAMHGASRSSLTGSAGAPLDVDPLYSGETYVQVEAWIIPGGTRHPSGTFNISFDVGQSEGELGGSVEPTAHATSGGAHVFYGETVNLAAGVFEAAFVADGNAASDDSITATFSIFCHGATPTDGPTPCVVDPIQEALLRQILELVTLIQRQAVPFAYVPSTVHSISGHGEIAVFGLLGCKITVTDVVAGTIGIESGDPDEAFGLGWITWGTADGWSPRAFLGHTDTVSMPRDASAMTLIGYTLAPGVTATLTELRREP
jgi:hypothetical protein